MNWSIRERCETTTTAATHEASSTVRVVNSCPSSPRLKRKHRVQQPGLKRGCEGQALVELALMTPLLFLLIVNVVNFGGFLYAWVTVANAARAAADYAVFSNASAGSPASPTNAQITSLVAAETSSLRTSVSVCVNRNATTSPTTGTCSFSIASIPADPEGSPYTSLAVDLRYTFTPFISAFSFPKLGIYATLPPTLIQRRAVMRVSN